RTNRAEQKMDQAEFDKFAEEYRALHAANIRFSGESPEYFAEYKVRDVASYLSRRGLGATRILDFGSGICSSLPHFRKYLPHAAVTCLDVSLASLDLGVRRFQGEAEFRCFDGVNIPFGDGEFDTAFAAGVFHHIEEKEHVRLFRELRRILTPGGHFFLFEHNPLNPLTVHAVRTCALDENAHLLRHSILRTRLEAAGFLIADCRFRVFFPN